MKLKRVFPQIPGSSPRVRGTLSRPFAIPPKRRFIPAGAGNTSLTVTSCRGLKVHPRGCGEHELWLFENREPPRFIPAGAGNTSGPQADSSQGPVHPRGCGEHFIVGQVCQDCCGSSPRVRGTRIIDGTALNEQRFIPAGAGNTIRPGIPATTKAVHPRGCGEHSMFRH